MSRIFYVIAWVAMAITIVGRPAWAQTAPAQPAAPAAQPARPTFETTKVEGTDNVYIFRYQNSQAMFVVTSAGVIATAARVRRGPAISAQSFGLREPGLFPPIARASCRRRARRSACCKQARNQPVGAGAGKSRDPISLLPPAVSPGSRRLSGFRRKSSLGLTTKLMYSIFQSMQAIRDGPSRAFHPAGMPLPGSSPGPSLRRGLTF